MGGAVPGDADNRGSHGCNAPEEHPHTWPGHLGEPVQEAAVDRHDRAGDVGGLGRCEEAHGCGDLGRRAHPAGGNVVQQLGGGGPSGP